MRVASGCRRGEELTGRAPFGTLTFCTPHQSVVSLVLLLGAGPYDRGPVQAAAGRGNVPFEVDTHMDVELDEFIQALSDSGLITADETNAFIRGLPEERRPTVPRAPVPPLDGASVSGPAGHCLPFPCVPTLQRRSSPFK